MTETRTQKPAFTDRRISNPLQYHYGTIPCVLLILLNWCEWPESNRHDRSREILSLLCLPISPHSHFFGVPPGTRTPTDSFGDCNAAITLGIHNWRSRRDSNPRPPA